MHSVRIPIAVVVAATLLLSGSLSAAASQAAFITFTVSSTTGVTCPSGTNESACGNLTLEPQIRSDNAGNFYASAEHGIGAGTSAFKSTDGGLHYTTLPSPNALSSTNNTGFAPAGADTDLATAPVQNGAGRYNVYVASLNGAEVVVSTSTDGGSTWSVNLTSATIPLDDREWIAADGASKVCIAYHDIITFNLDVNCSQDAGATFTQLGSAIDSAHLFLLAGNNGSGNLAIDPASHVVYQVFSGIADTGEIGCGLAGTCGFHVVYAAVSTDGGQTFTDHVVYANRDAKVAYGHQFVQISIDRTGNLYVLFSDNHNLFYSVSTDQGASWSDPAQVNSAPSATAIMPWSVAGDAGTLDVVWYGTSFFDGVTPPDNYPSSAQWFVYFAQNLHATKPHSHFHQVQATPVIHTGGVCEGGISCLNGNRDLFDDFGIAADSLNGGLASIIYTDDQYLTPDASNANYTATCSPAQNNTVYCDHVAVATQTSGRGIFGG